MKGLLLTSLLAILLAIPIFAQDEVESVELPDVVMEQLVKRIITSYFKPRSRRKEIYISEQNIKKEWLPRIKNIEFVLVPESSWEVTREFYLFKEVERRGGMLSIGFGYGDSCDHNGDLWYFRIEKNRISVRKNKKGEFRSRCNYGSYLTSEKKLDNLVISYSR